MTAESKKQSITKKTDGDPNAIDESDSRFGRFRIQFGIADVLFFVFAVGIIQRSRGSMLDDPGLGWHLRNVDAMWSRGGCMQRSCPSVGFQ